VIYVKAVRTAAGGGVTATSKLQVVVVIFATTVRSAAVNCETPISKLSKLLLRSL
jgi:hypothetical protein